jgi:23S rRNA pseudouridine2605 synthase
MNAPDADPLPPEAVQAEPNPSATAETPAPKPPRKRAPRKTAASEVDVPAAVDAVTAPAAHEVFGRADSGPAVADAGSNGPAAEPREPAPAPAAEAASAEPAGGAEATTSGLAPEGPPGGAGDGERGPRRGRNRRRGRRGGERARDAQGAAVAADGSPLPERDDVDVPAAEPATRVPAPLAVEVFAEVLSGAYDADASVPEDAAEAAEAVEPGLPPKRVLAAEPDAPKLQKVLAQAGVGSRRDLEQMIAEGRVTVNGDVAHTGQRISFGDRIQVDGKPVRYRIAPPPPRVLAYHKPAGEVVTHDDPQQRPTVFRRLPRLPQGKWQSVGRLDINTEGLLLFTNSGELANQLMHPRFGVEREYAVRSLGLLDDEARTRLLEGVEIDGQRCGFKRIEDGGGEGVNHWYRVVITEGRNREVRKLFEAVGHAVSRLIRIRYGSVVLPRGLKRGVWVDLDEHDVRTLRRLAAPQRAPEAAGDAAGPVNRRGRNRRGKGRGGERPPEAAAERAPDRGPERGPRPNRANRADRAERLERPDRPERAPRGPRFEPGEGGVIPNPLQQTFDKRAFQQERQRREIPEDGPIPNPLQQTFDKRALQQARAQTREIPEDGPIPNPLQQTYDKRFAQANRGGKKGGGDPEQIPDPMQTSVGYIGADAFRRKNGGGRGGRRGGTGGGGGGGAGTGGQRSGGGGNRGPRRGR